MQKISNGRIKKDLGRITRDKNYKNLYEVDVISDKDFSLWDVILIPSEKSIYYGKKFILNINFSNINYPFSPPKIIFKNKIFHPNIDLKGNICLDLLTKDGWNASLSILNILKSILSLLELPNPNDQLNIDAANLYKNNYEEFKKKIKNF